MSLNASPGSARPLPGTGSNLTGAPGTARPAPSTSRTTTGSGSASPGNAPCPRPESTAISATAAPGSSAVAPISARAPISTQAANVCRPGDGPSVHSVAATPKLSLFTPEGFIPPPPTTGSNLTSSAGTAVPPASSTRTPTGSSRGNPAAALWPAPNGSRTLGSCSTRTGAIPASLPSSASRFAVPLPRAVTSPAASTVNTVVSVLLHVTPAPPAAPASPVIRAENVIRSPMYVSVAESGTIVSNAVSPGSATWPESQAASKASNSAGAATAGRKPSGTLRLRFTTGKARCDAAAPAAPG